MARRRRKSRRRSFTRSVRRRGRKDPTKIFIGLALTSTVEPFIDSLAGSVGLNVSDDLIKLGAGWWLSKKSGYIKGIGYGLFGRAAGNLVGNLLQGGLGGLFGGNGNTVNGANSSDVVQ